MYSSNLPESGHRLVPPYILQNLAQDKRRGEFSAIALFVDISGFTAMTGALMKFGPHGAEVLAAVMREVFEPLILSVFEQGGFISGFAGDAFTALFPFEESDTEVYWRAIVAARQIQQTVAQLATSSTPYGEFPLSIKLGMASGAINWGIVSSLDGRRAVYYFQGTALEGCSECEHLAKAGEIIVDQAVYDQLGQRVVAEPKTGYYRINSLLGELPPRRTVTLPSTDTALQERFFPSELIRQAYNGEFRQVVNMFIRLPTVRTETQLEIFLNSLFELQERYGGLLNRLDFGDKGSHLLLFWGAPVSYENDIERALNFILDLQRVTSIPINAGITYQMAHAGFIGSSLSEEYTCYGQGVNLAARFMTAAPRGEIWVDEQIARRSQKKFEIEFEGRQVFKGFADEQPVYLLYERKQHVEELSQGELFGRQAELAQLATFFAPVLEGEFGGALVVFGEAGIGKSHFVHAFIDSTQEERPDTLCALCQTDEIVRGTLNPFRYWLRTYFDVTETQVEARNKRNFNRKLDGLIAETRDPNLASELDRTRSFLAALLDLYWTDSLYEQLDAKGRYENTLIALTALLQAESLRQPVIIFLEDAHWLDQDTRIFLPRFARALTSDESKTFPIGIIATARPEGESQVLGEGLVFQEIVLERMGSDDLALLVEAQLAGPVKPELVKLLIDRSEGNPFFAEQIVSFLKEEQLLEQAEAGWSIRKRQIELLPTDVRAVLVARLDRLVREVREVVQAAAVLGREFEVQLLARMLGEDLDLNWKVAEAEKATIWLALDELRYLFKHALLRDAAYRMQVRARRQSLHALAVEALEHVHAGDLSAHFGELAYHAEQAGLEEKARQYLRQAGETALKDYQNNQAIDYFSRALAITSEWAFEERLSLLLAREQVYRLLGAQEARFQDLLAAENMVNMLAGNGQDSSRADKITQVKAQLALRKAEFAMDTGEYAGAIDAAGQAVAIALEIGAPHLTVEAYNIWSLGLLRTGKFDEATQQAVVGLDIARQHGDRRGESLLLNLLGMIALEQNRSSTACMFLSQSLQIARETGDPQNEARPLTHLGNSAANEGDYSSARDYYEQVMRIAREIGNRRLEGITLVNLGWLAGVQGDYAAALDYGKQILRIAREVGDRYQEAYALINFSSWVGAQSDWQAALAYAEQGLALSRATGDPSAEAWSLTYIGHARFEQGLLEEAAGAYQAAIGIRRSLNQSALETEPLAGLSRVAQAAGEEATAFNHLEALLAYLETDSALEGTEEPLRVYWTCYAILQAAQDPRAEKILQTAYDLLQARAERISDRDARQAFLANVPYHQKILAAWELLPRE